MDLQCELLNYKPYNVQEKKDQERILKFLEQGDAVYARQCEAAHITASAWVTNREHSKVLMAYHNIYDSWAWLGGHADGETDLLLVAEKEAKEESGLISLQPVGEDIFSIEVLPVFGHIKNGSYVPSHLHLNVTYLMEADEAGGLRPKEDENCAVRWFLMEEGIRASKEPWMQNWIYRKLASKMK